MKPKFIPGANIAMKVPPHQFADTVTFYRDVLGLPVIEKEHPAMVFEFGNKRLWIDQAPQLNQAELWLELQTDNLAEATEFLARHGVVRCDAIEKLPQGFEGFWISNPAGIIHLVCKKKT